MGRLDDREFVLRNDPSGMYDLTVGFGEQCRRALALAPDRDLTQERPSNVVLAGMGGSAAGGDFVQALFEASGSCPFFVNRDYSLPAFVGEDTLVFAVSYSGNTEETLAAYHDACSRGAKIVCVAGGGRLAELAHGRGDALISIPSGQPPRTALGYLFVPVAKACVQMGLIPDPGFESAFDLLDECATDWAIEALANPTKGLATALHGALPVLYGLGSWQGQVARRWKAQINENAKSMTWARAYPELCHNEVLGWVGAENQGVLRWECVVLQDGCESAKMRTRAEVVAGLISDKCETHYVTARGETLLEKMLSLTLLGDFVSLYMAALYDVDPENIDWLNTLKSRLAAVPY